MFIAYLTLLSALSISGVAIFYSVIGLATIFPGAFWPVVIMGSVLEVGKLVTASWLYRHWKQTRILLKIYLTIAVIVLSLITSMGIFGFLSKAHLEQNLAENTVTQRIEIINSKINSEKTYIERQELVIDRAEKTLSRVVENKDGALEIEKENLSSVEDKFKTLLAVETNTIKNLNDRLKILDKDVSDVLTANKAWFNEEKAAADLKASQKEERDLINTKITESQSRIAQLKKDYADETQIIQDRMAKLRANDVQDKSTVYEQIELAEANILKAQNNIDALVVEREPLEAKMIKLEAEVGPVKYIAALAIDWGVTKEVDTSEAVRWVILVIIFVFDPLAVLLLIAANQSLLARFPVKPLPPEEVLDLEKPDEEDVALKWNEAMVKNQKAKMETATAQLKDWKDKLEKFNTKVPKPELKPVTIIQEEKKTEDKEIVADNTSDPADVIKAIKKEQEQEAKEKQLEEFKKREIEERKALEKYAQEAKTEELVDESFADILKDGFDPDEVEFDLETEKPKSTTVKEALKMDEFESVQTPISEPTIAEQIEEVMESERTRPDFTQVLEPEVAVKPKQGTIGVRKVDNKGKVNVEISDEQFGRYKKRVTSEENYHQRIEQRIDDLIGKLERKEIQFTDLPADDKKVILDILNQKDG